MDEQPFVPEILCLDILREAISVHRPNANLAEIERFAERFERFVMTGSFADKR